MPGMTFWEFLALSAVGCAIIVVLLVAAFIRWRKCHRLVAGLSEVKAFGRLHPLLMRAGISLYWALPFLVAVLMIIGLWRLWDQPFSSLAYDDQKLELTYYGRLAPVTLPWTKISRISMIPDEWECDRTAITVYSTDGKVYVGRSADPRSHAGFFLRDTYQFMLARRAWSVYGVADIPDESLVRDANTIAQTLLHGWGWHPYNVDPYIQAAARIQAFDRKTAVGYLRLIARDDDLHGGNKVIPLCRMLFTKRAGGEFQRPSLGAAAFLGGTDYADWPLEPIEIVDGVPFMITGGYTVAGFPEPREKYLVYCLTNCDWSTVRFTPRTTAEKNQALDKLLASPKWKTPPGREFFSSQIE